MFKGLPEIAYHDNMFGKAVALKPGVNGYFEVITDKCANELNDAIGVTKAQAEAMFIGSLFSWDAPGANPEMCDKNGKLKKERLIKTCLQRIICLVTYYSGRAAC